MVRTRARARMEPKRRYLSLSEILGNWQRVQRAFSSCESFSVNFLTLKDKLYSDEQSRGHAMG